MKSWWWHLCHAMGVPAHVPSWREQLAAVLTSAAGIALIATSSLQLAPGAAPWLLTSMGATAVLVFAVPHGPLSQPWAVLGGHLLSALAALIILQLAGSGIAQSACAVGMSIAVMHLARCIHPPGGATALYIMQSASAGAAPQWSWLLHPVLLNVTLALLSAVLLNYAFPWRRYPAALAFRQQAQPLQALSQEAPFSAQELAQALDGLDAVLDITDEQLQLLYQNILSQQFRSPLDPATLAIGGYYSNGLAGENWAVRQIIDGNAADSRKPQLIVKTVAGEGRGQVQLMGRLAFANWAKYQVYPDKDHWQREPTHR